MDTPIAAQYAVFCFGPPGEEAACIAEGCAFAAVMSDYNLEKAIRTASNEQTVRQAFLEHITDLVVLPHVHIHSSLRTHLRGSEKNSNVSTPSGRGSPIKGRNEANVTEVTPTRMSGVVRNRADATDVLEDLLELCITDFEHADDAARGVGRHDIHEETHMHKHEDGETITFDDNDHTESFVIMRAIDTDGPFAGCQRTLHRWHNALQQVGAHLSSFFSLSLSLPLPLPTDIYISLPLFLFTNSCSPYKLTLIYFALIFDDNEGLCNERVKRATGSSRYVWWSCDGRAFAPALWIALQLSPLFFRSR